MARITVMIITGLALGACAMTPEKWAAVPDDRICARTGEVPSYATYQHYLGLEQLVRRGKIQSQQHVNMIQDRKIAIGMNSCELLAAWGPPTDQNRSVSQWGTNTQWVYGTFRSSGGPKYVYTENQIVTSWQD